MFVEIHEYLAARKTNTMALADRYAFIKSEIEALGKELEKVRFEIKQTGVERLVGERAIVEVALSERSTLDTKAAKEFLTADQIKRLYDSSKEILKEVGYQGAGTCEFLVAQDGTISFLEVNTRLQVEHPVSEEVTGLDLVREQFRLAEGGRLEYGDPEVRGHSFEFRINGEDAGRNFMPAPGPVHTFKAPSGPGVRVDTGIESGEIGRASCRERVYVLV